MTGYGKAEVLLESGKICVEIRTLNSKSADVNIKTQLLPKDREMLVRQTLSRELQRGTIDFFMTFEANAAESARVINRELALSYFRQIAGLTEAAGKECRGFGEPDMGTIIR